MSLDDVSLSDVSTKSVPEVGILETEKPKYSDVCGYAINVDSNSKCFNNSKWFDSVAESEILNSSLSALTSNASSPNEKYWICCKCRRATTDRKSKFSRINKRLFYYCNDCFKQRKMQLIWGMLFRQIQFHLPFTMVWIPSPDGVFLGDKSRNYTEWVIIVILLVFTLVFQIAGFINAIAVRPISDLRRKQHKRPVLDIWLETKCASCWVAIIAIMVHDGVHQYGNNGWNGQLIALLTCAVVTLLLYLFTSFVAIRNWIQAKTTVAKGLTDPFGDKPKFSWLQAIAFLS